MAMEHRRRACALFLRYQSNRACHSRQSWCSVGAGRSLSFACIFWSFPYLNNNEVDLPVDFVFEHHLLVSRREKSLHVKISSFIGPRSAMSDSIFLTRKSYNEGPHREWRLTGRPGGTYFCFHACLWWLWKAQCDGSKLSCTSLGYQGRDLGRGKWTRGGLGQRSTCATWRKDQRRGRSNRRRFLAFLWSISRSQDQNQSVKSELDIQQFEYPTGRA